MMNMLAATLVPWAAVAVLLAIVVFACIATLLVAHGLGPKRRGPVKDSPYESGMPVVGGTEQRFHIRFYIVAMLFLLFDVEVVFLWPWAQAFHRQATGADGPIALETGELAGAGFLLAGMGLFFLLLVFGLVYEWKRGAFRWDQS